MGDSALKSALNKSLEDRFRRSSNYDHVAVLVLYWKDCTDKGYSQEASQVAELFKGNFGYRVDRYEIPCDASELELDARISNFLLANRKPDTLLILHYGGHGNPDDDRGQDQESVWCAEPDEGSPSLKWSNIQPKLKQHESDVLVLLDCCYGAQAARDNQARRRSPVPPNVELLAACGMGEKTIRPGPQSFTSLLLAELRSQLDQEGYAVMALTHKNMAAKQSRLGQSAGYFPLERRGGTIHLQPLQRNTMDAPGRRKAVASLIMEFSVSDSDRQAFEDVIEWLKINPPRSVSRVAVEDIIRSATAVYQYASSGREDGQRSTSNFSSLPDPAQKDVWSRWRTFGATVSGLARYVGGSQSTETTPLLSIDELSEDVVRGLNKALGPVQSAIERNVMSLPEMADEKTLLKAIDDKLLEDLGFGDTLKMRLAAHFDAGSRQDGRMEMNPGDIPFGPDSRFQSFAMAEVSPLGQVLVECQTYTKGAAERPALVSSKRSMQTLATLLNSSKSADFHTLTCLRFFHEPLAGRYGLVFAIPKGSRPCQISLRDIIDRVASKYKPTLGERFDMAHKVGKAILKWHLVDWVHQGIASHNVIFFYDPAIGVDYSKPYLCGFAYSRESMTPSTGRFVEDFDLNVYRHPDRQGVPTKYHRKEHDIYAYGILLLEIGMWGLVGKLFSDEERGSLSPYQMGQKIAKTSQETLAHVMGSPYEQATRMCLTGEFGVDLDDTMQSNLAAAFDTKILEALRQGVAIGK
ncbi:hypothetical protein B0H67DRAFT_645944 [Lasiosphaeris hirsuta]|uniref:Protein kinase domain-containing protein n=1 Tax=Lasiosphaeris hirsuta TaxID=260670 RepID=A0AA40AI91_9PEZI|nr:hypothetical protein B0H67DRAFT_645944 [Lasiosphaeris hirsuta]